MKHYPLKNSIEYDGNVSDALLHLRSYIAGIPYDIITKDEWDDRQKTNSQPG